MRTLTKAADANVVETADAVRTLIPDLKRYIPADIDIAIMSDRTTTIRASIADMLYEVRDGQVFKVTPAAG